MLKLINLRGIKKGITLRSNPNLLFKEVHSMKEIIIVRPYSHKELSDLYGISRKTFRKWVSPFKREIGERMGWYYTALQVETIFMKLGLPYDIRGEE